MIRTHRLSALLLLALLGGLAGPAVADEYLIYSESGIPAGGSDVWVWCQTQTPQIPCDFGEIQQCANPEGTRTFRMRGVESYMGFGLFHNIDPGPDGQPDTGDEFATPVDLSAYVGGELRFFVKSAIDLNIEMQCQAGGQDKGGLRLLSDTNWDGTATWQEVVVPLSDFDFGAGPPVNQAECLGAVLAPFMSTAVPPSVSFNSFEIDNVRWRKANAHAGASSVQASGRQFLVNGEPFVVNGVAYTPISIGEDWRGAQRDRADRYLVDFPLIAATGANTVRIYSTYLTTGMLDAAWASGLFVIPTFSFDPVQLTCAEGRDYMRDRFIDSVNQWKDHPAILAWLVGNEVNVNLGPASLCGDWYPQLNVMAQAAHVAEGASFHPVGTANADTSFADICQPGCSDDVSLPDVDFWGVQVYRGCSLGTLFSEYAGKSDCARPLMVTEFGADAWDSLSGSSGAENQAMQADCLATLLDDADQGLAVRTSGGVSTGQIVFSWADEWWKAFALDPPVAGFCDVADNTLWTTQDTCKSWESLGYPDPAMNEEWWGITGVDAADPNARTPRAAQTTVGESWHVGNACNMDIAIFDAGTGDTTLTFDPAPGSTEHTLHYGPLSAVSTYGYTGAVSGLGATGSSALTLPGGELFWLVVGRNSVAEGGYGTGVVERPSSPGAAFPQDPNRTGLCSSP